MSNPVGRELRSVAAAAAGLAQTMMDFGDVCEEAFNWSPCCPSERTTVFQVGGLRLPWSERKEVRRCNGCGEKLPLFLVDLVLPRKREV